MDIAAAKCLSKILDALVADLVPLQIQLLEPLGLCKVLVDLVDVVVTDTSATEAKYAFINLCAESSGDSRLFTDFLSAFLDTTKRFRQILGLLLHFLSWDQVYTTESFLSSGTESGTWHSFGTLAGLEVPWADIWGAQHARHAHIVIRPEARHAVVAAGPDT